MAKGKVGKKKVERVPREGRGGFSPFAIELVKVEAEHSGSSGFMGFAAAIDINDILHSAGLITNDAWNMKKGWIQTTQGADIWATAGVPTLKTLVEAPGKLRGKGGKEEEGYSEADISKLQQALAAVESANADGAVEG